MDAEVKRDWVAALRSDEYRQGRKRLQSDEGFCCLGVLCDLHAKATGGGWDLGIEAMIYDGGALVLPQSVMTWAGLNADDPEIRHRGVRVKLTALNDGKPDGDVRRHAFAEIARIIEEQL